LGKHSHAIEKLTENAGEYGERMCMIYNFKPFRTEKPAAENDDIVQ